MCNVGKMYRWAGYPAGRQQILAALVMLGAMCAVAGAQIDVNETGLHDGQSVYGLYAPPTPIPYVNLEDITLFAWGETDPSLYTNVSFYAHGLYTDVNLVNIGAIGVTATGGMADADALDAYADAQARAYGIYSAYGLITNSGGIDVTASGGTAWSGATGTTPDTSASGLAYGLYAEDGAIENTADASVSATGGSATGTATDTQHEVFAAARACGLYLDDDDWYAYTDRHLSNSGNLTATATGGSAQGSTDEANASARAYGIEAYDAPVINTGQIVAAAAGGDALSTSNATIDVPGAYAHAFAHGIESDDGDLNNSGAVTASATGGTATGQGAAEASAGAEAIGIEASGQSSTPEIAEVQNTGAIIAMATGGTASSTSASAAADAIAYGLSTSYANVDNTGTISITAQGGTALAGEEDRSYAAGYACGLSADSGTLNNSGAITAAGRGGTADGQSVAVHAYAMGLMTYDTSIDNSGDITVIAQAGDIPADSSGVAIAYAVGMAATNNNVTNSGDITVTAEAGAAAMGDIADAEAYGIAAVTANVNNTGNIAVTAAGGDGFDSKSYGIHFAGVGTLTNTGVIRATGNTAYELYMEGGSALTLIDTYNVTLDGDPDQGSVYVGDAATLALNGATLTVSAVSGETLWDTEYRLFETAGTGVVDGNFAEVRAVNPNTTAHYYDQNSVDSVDDTVSLAYTPGAAPTLASAAVEKQAISQAVDVVNHHMTTVLLQNILFPPSSGLLASAGSTAESLALVEGASGKSVGVFVEPYYSRVDKDADPLGYDAKLWGFSAGYERYLGNTLLGLHLGYGRSDIDYTGAGYNGNSEDQDVVTGGLSGLTRWDPWVLHYGLTGFYGSHDYQGLTGLALDERETASYDSYGVAATLMAGRIFRWDSHVLLPEAGLNWLWVHRQRYTTEATDPSWDATYSALDDHDLYAAASVRWLSSFLHDDVRVTPSAAVGIRHLLTDTEASVWQSIPGAAPVLVKSKQDRTALTVSGSLILTRTRHAVSLSYDGDYFPDAQRHSVWLRYSWLF